jgi:hypothetical protein
MIGSGSVWAGSKLLALMGPMCKLVEVIADRHGEGEQLFERLLGLVELDGESARFHAYPHGQALPLLVDNRHRGFDRQLRLLKPLPPQLDHRPGDPLPALDFSPRLFARRDLFQPPEKGFPLGQPIGAHPFGHARGEDLLGAAASDAQERLHRGAVDKGAGQGAHRRANGIEIVEPGGLVRHPP